MITSNAPIGSWVRCYVYVGTEARPMHYGKVTENRDGYCMVDRMGPFGGKPWVCSERWVEVMDSPPNPTKHNEKRAS